MWTDRLTFILSRPMNRPEARLYLPILAPLESCALQRKIKIKFLKNYQRAKLISKEEKKKSKKKKLSFAKRMQKCGPPGDNYARLVVSSLHHKSLYNVDDVKLMCDLASVYNGVDSYQDVCVRAAPIEPCCRVWTIGNYVSLLTNKTSCLDITAQDLSFVYSLIVKCSPFFHNATLKDNCQDYSSDCPGVPEECYTFDAIYNIIYYLIDINFIKSDKSTLQPIPKISDEAILKYSTIVLPIPSSIRSLNCFEHLEASSRSLGVYIEAAYFGDYFKFDLFHRYLVLDSVWLGVAGGVVFIVMWLYTTSIFITFMTFLSLFWAVQTTYFIYTFIFKIKFFPYMNMVILIVMIGVGADDLFIFCRVWHMVKSEKNNGVLEKIVGDTLRHTILSMLVTSITTSAAFYANFISDITAIRCFSVFAGTCMIVNFILTVTWLPASIILYEKWCRCCVGISKTSNSIMFSFCKIPFKLYYLISDWSRVFFEKLLPCLIIKFRYVWIFFLGAVWLASVIIIFYYPRLKLPSSEKFQMFSSDNLLEKYDFKFSDMFYFQIGNDDERKRFPVVVVWGVLPDDNGDQLNPDDKGRLVLDPKFDLTTARSQEWILGFCSRLRLSDFYADIPGYHLSECHFFEHFVKYMKSPCSTKERECCNQTFPFHKSKMISCLSSFIEDVQNTPMYHYSTHSPGPRFSKGKLTAFFVEFTSNWTYSHSYSSVEAFYRKIDNWVSEEMSHAPTEMKRGFFVSNLGFYDLQVSLAFGTPLTLGVSLLVVTLVCFFTSLNSLITIYAVLTVAASISVTLAALVLLGWELNVLESIVITLSIGLAVDFTLHYGMAFRLAPDIGREMRVITSVGRMGSPVSMAAFTSIIAGVFMMPSTVLAYQKFGIFMILLVSIAWIYATFFFQALLRIIGPNGGFGQFHWPVFECCSPNSKERVDKTIYALSESTLSSSSTSTREHSHLYNRELEPLTDRDRSRSPHASNRHHYYPYQSDAESHVRAQYQRRRLHHHHHHHHRSKSKGYVSVKTSESQKLDTNGDDVISPTQNDLEQVDNIETESTNTNETGVSPQIKPTNLYEARNHDEEIVGVTLETPDQTKTHAQIEILPHPLPVQVV